ncbi:hypothetical protein L210DRAFT_3403529 [Boletus edulis BED1]|uniref:Oxidoreductase-like domain-containing protein n=1 Tax=Boletus edulis BED1 TaxID=1328754 RepID=A0AAD4GET6_BOLED|nr:hypothetical protein L210DRAFT_3403529 [Boletus edulis BED1]
MLSPLPWSLRRPVVLRVRLGSSSVPTPRRGQNLTERYRRLENSTRAKSEHVSVLFQSSQIADGARTSKPPDTIAGFVIPQEPHAPADDECCMSGCAVCVYDLYEEALTAYKDSVITLRTALAARHMPETEWPAHIRTGKATHADSSHATADKTKGAVLDAFEEMERALKEKREKRTAVEAESPL